MKKLLAAAVLFTILQAAGTNAAELVSYVDPFIGTTGSVNTFPGATLPFGMVRLSPDTDSLGPSGYISGSNVKRFSHLHVSGTGAGKYGNVGVMPIVGTINPASHSSAESGKAASPGYYSTTLSAYGVKAELTAARHTGVHRYTFPASSSSHIIVDAACATEDGNVRAQGPGSVFVNPAAKEITGSNTYHGGWGHGSWTVYFCAKFDTSFSGYGTWLNSAVTANSTSETSTTESLGGYADFNTSASQVINVKVGISFVSAAQARSNADNEAPGWDFNSIKTAAKNEWEAELQKIQVEGGTDSDKKMFYTAIYHTMLMPTDVTGEAPGFTKAHYEDFFCLWDTFRTVHPLFSLVETRRNADMVNTFLDIYSKTGWMPADARIAFASGNTQVGSNSDVLLCDAFVKGLPGIDYETAFAAMKMNGDSNSGDNSGTGSGTGRPGINSYKQYHYLPANCVEGTKNTVSKTLEYVYDDYCIYTVAKGLGRAGDAAYYYPRLDWYKNVWDSGQGFVRGKMIDGNWYSPFSPSANENWTGTQWYEGTAWGWSWWAPHDMAAQLMGGETAFNSKLETMLSSYYSAGNEPDIQCAYLFNYAGKPDRTQYWVRRLTGANYSTSSSGIPGNDDAGCMSSWYVFAAMGFYPVAGQNLYLVGSPLFTKVVMHMENGKDLVISAPNASSSNIYIQSAQFNGSPLNNAFFRHTDITGGATIYFTMGSAASNWGGSTRPYSYSSAPSTADTTAPVIAAVAAAVSSTSAIITWTTDDAASTRVEYGQDAAYGCVTEPNASLVTAHTAVVANLLPGTTYHYRVLSVNCESLPAAGSDRIFVTIVFAAEPPAAPPVVPVLPVQAGMSVNSYPNPFIPGSGSSAIRFAVTGADSGELRIYTLSGKLVKAVPMAYGQASWNGANCAEAPVGKGLYFYVVQDLAGNKFTGKLLVR